MRGGIVGAAGVLGRQVAPRLVERGHVVRSVVRRESEKTRLGRLSVDAIVGDILEPESLSKGLDGCEAVLHLATAIPRAGTPNPGWSLKRSCQARWIVFMARRTAVSPNDDQAAWLRQYWRARFIA